MSHVTHICLNLACLCGFVQIRQGAMCPHCASVVRPLAQPVPTLQFITMDGPAREDLKLAKRVNAQ